MNTQYRKNLLDLAQASKDYTDKKAQEILWKVGEYDITTQNDNTSALVKTAPSGATRVKIKRVSGNCVKYAPSTASDDSVAKDKVIPENTYTTELNTLGGMSYKSENTFVIPDRAELTDNGITYSVTNGVLTMNGTASSSFNFGITLSKTIPADTYSSLINISGTTTSTGNWLLSYSRYEGSIFNLGNTDGTTKTSTTTQEASVLRFYVNAGTVFTNYKIKVMLVSGSTAPTEFKQGFEGIRDSAVSSIVVSGTDMPSITKTIPQEIQALEGYGWGINSSVYNYIDFINKKFIQKVGTRAYQSGDEEDTSVLTDLTITYYELATPIETDISSLLPADFNKITTNDNYTDIEFVSEYGYDIPNKVSYYGTIKETLCTAINKNDALAISLTNNEAKYGWSVNDVYNTRDYTTIKGGQKVNRVNLGTLTWGKANVGTNQWVFYSSGLSTLIKSIANDTIVANLLTSLYKTTNYKVYSDFEDKTICQKASDSAINVVDLTYSSASDFKAAMNGVYLYYELATEVVEDITPLDNNVIEVVENDELGFVNSENQAVPSEITYRIEVEK